MAQRLTDKLVRSLEPPAKGNRITYDTAVAGFGLRVTAAARRAFVLTYRRKGDQLERRYTIGAFPDWSRDGGARGGQAPQARHRSAAAIRSARSRPTARRRPWPTSAPASTRSTPEEAPEHAVRIPGDDPQQHPARARRMRVERLRSRTSTACTARSPRPHALPGQPRGCRLSKMFSLAINWRMRADNPCRGVERNQEFASANATSSPTSWCG